MIIGIDEAGRGALAGPVVVGAVAIKRGFYPKDNSLPPLRDSKKLSHNHRALWFEYIKEHPEIYYSSGRVYQRTIDDINIAKSANLAASRALEKMFREIPPQKASVILDGSLYLGKNEHNDIKSRTIIRGDEKFVSIKLASIVAKVIRDKYMIKNCHRYPEYGFESHKGYGTKLHKKMIRKHGISELHRLTYIKI